MAAEIHVNRPLLEFRLSNFGGTTRLAIRCTLRMGALVHTRPPIADSSNSLLKVQHRMTEPRQVRIHFAERNCVDENLLGVCKERRQVRIRRDLIHLGLAPMADPIPHTLFDSIASIPGELIAKDMRKLPALCSVITPHPY